MIIFQIFLLWISHLFVRLNKPLWLASVDDKSLHRALTGSRLKSHLNWSQLRFGKCAWHSLMWHCLPDPLSGSREQKRRERHVAHQGHRCHLWDVALMVWRVSVVLFVLNNRDQIFPQICLDSLMCTQNAFRLPTGIIGLVCAALIGKDFWPGTEKFCEAGRAFYWPHIAGWLFIDYLLLCLWMYVLSSWVTSTLHIWWIEGRHRICLLQFNKF